MSLIAIKQALLEAQNAVQFALSNPEILQSIDRAGETLADVLQKGGRVYACGNGGSFCDAMHFAEEMTGRFRRDRKPFAAAAISDGAHMSCVSNDFGYDEVFSRYIEAFGREGDALLCITTSGKSPNVIRAARVARGKGMRVIALTGYAGTEIAGLCDINVVTPAGSGYADRIQEMHIKVVHILIELVERRLAPENYDS